MTKRALCIGINDYPGTDSDLHGCVNDAQDWAVILKARDFDVAPLLLDRKATGRAIRQAISSLLVDSKKGDLAVIQYSGHGSYVPDKDGDEPDGRDECLCPYDVRSKGPIVDDELFGLLSDRPQGVKLVMFSDSCHSGSVTRFAPIDTPPTIKGRSAPQRLVRFLPPAAFLPKAKLNQLGISRALRRSNPPGRHAGLLMAGCEDSEFSYDAYFNGRPNGAFTFVALRELKKLPAQATYKQWFDAIRKVLPSQQYPQTPNLFGTGAMRKWRVLS
jgi:hypothetical protein